MHLFFIKALWLAEIRLSMCLDNLMASILETSLAKECIRLMGLKSDACCAISVFGIKVIAAPLSFSKGPVVKLYMHSKALRMSC